MYPLELALKLFKPQNTFCASEVLLNKFTFLGFAKVLQPYYSEKSLENLINKKKFDFKAKSDLMFLGNINSTKQIYEFSFFFNKFIAKKDNLKLLIYGEAINQKIK